MIDPKLYTFVTLVEAGTTLRCAEALHLSQPAVTQHIRALEAEYGAKLFVKEGRRLALTGAGERFYRLAKRLPALAAAGLGVTFAYEIAAAPLLESGRLTRLAAGDFSLTRPFAFVTLPDSPLARRESGLFDRVRTLCAGL